MQEKISPVKNNPKRKKILLWVGVAIALITAFILYRIFSIGDYAWNLIDVYLSFLEGIINRLHAAIGTGVHIEGHSVYVHGEFAADLDDGYLLKKWTLLLLLVFWITPVNLRPRLMYTGCLIIVHPFGSLINIGLTSYLLLFISYDEAAAYIGRTPFVLIMLTFLTTWIWRNRKNIFSSKISKQFRLEFLEPRLPQLFIVLLIFVLLSNLFLGSFKYTFWIEFLFRLSAGVLHLLGYIASVESQLLVGEYGSIRLAKSCLGLNTMLLFASIVYFTGKDGWVKWLYILGGIVLLNLLNIARFVLIFLHIQKNQGYVTELNTHDLYNSLIYGIIFIMWIVWFEKFSFLRDSDP